MRFYEGQSVWFRENGNEPARAGYIKGTCGSKPLGYIVELPEEFGRRSYIEARENELTLRRKKDNGTD